MFCLFGASECLGVWGGAPGSYKRSDPQSGLGFVGIVYGKATPVTTSMLGRLIYDPIRGMYDPIGVIYIYIYIYIYDPI